ncbi:aftiphilin-like [Mytilus californianus]|uniref:aftiphilin-like n=1 Tax=Mytilus californianus TaxID=6549 RepID=UPI002246120A|nr:aftiphilin-like [Mytilus californianus]
MSNVIPIVSSSPPPLEDTGGFDDWGDDDDFGGFMGADETPSTWNNSISTDHTNAWNNSINGDQSTTLDEVNANITNKLPQHFTNAEKIENCKTKSSPLSLNLDKSLPYNNISNDVSNDQHTDLTESKTSDTISGNSTGDSGLFDVSPVPISEDTKSDHSEISTDQETFQNTPDDIPSNETTLQNNDLNTNSEEILIKNGNHIGQNDDGEISSSTKHLTQSVESEEVESICNVDTENENKKDSIVEESIGSCPLETNEINEESVLSNSCSSLDNDNVISSDEICSSHEEKQCSIEYAASQENVNQNDVQKQTDNVENSMHLSEENLCDNTLHSGEFEVCEGKEDDKNSENDNLNTNSPEETDKISGISEDKKITSCDDLENSGKEFADFSIAEGRENHSSENLVQSDKVEFENSVQVNDSENNEKVSLCMKNDGNQETEIKDLEFEDKVEFAEFSETTGDVDKDIENVSLSSAGESKEESVASFKSVPEEEKEDEVIKDDSDKDISDEDEFADFSSAPVGTDSDGIDNLTSGTTNESTKSEGESIGGSVDTEACSNNSGLKPVDDEQIELSNSSTVNVEKDNFANFSSTQNENEQKEVDQIADDEFADFSSAAKDDEFADFSSASKDDEFADFSSAVKENGDSKFGNFNNSEDKFESDDEFADFSSATKGDEFTDFSATGSQEQTSSFQASDKADWATFQQTTTPEPVKTPVESKSSTQKNVGSLLSGCFENTAVVSESTSDLDVVVEDNSNQLWMKIQKMDNSGQLKWPQCSCNKNLYVSLKIDTKNILLGYKKPTVPIYAANLTLLEPTKGSPTLPEVPLVDTNKQVEVKDLPPVQFDWTSSGLTNPLEVNNKLQHLDFLNIDDSELTAKKAFDADLIHGQKPAMQPLQNILANLKVTKKTRLEDLSNEAGRVISHLPNLSFMKAKVLMFPLKTE